MKKLLPLFLLAPAALSAQNQFQSNKQVKTQAPVQQYAQQASNINYYNINGVNPWSGGSRLYNQKAVNPAPVNKAKVKNVQQQNKPAPANRGRGLDNVQDNNRIVQNDNNINNDQPLPRNFLLNVAENNENPVVQQAAEPVQEQQAAVSDRGRRGIEMPQMKLPSMSSSSGSSVTISSSHSFRKDFRKKLRSTKRKFQKTFSHSKKKKADIATCFAFGN